MANDTQLDKIGQKNALTKTQETAAVLVADDKLTDQEIADECKIVRATLANWKKLPAFVARVEEHQKAWREVVMSTGIADKATRLAGMNNRYGKLNRVIEARAKRYSEEIDAAPLDALGSDDKETRPRIPPEEAREGVILETVIYTKEGPRIEWAVDTGLLSEISRLEKEAAAELGQRIVKTEQTVRGLVGIAPVNLAKLTGDDLDTIESLLMKAGGDDGNP